MLQILDNYNELAIFLMINKMGGISVLKIHKPYYRDV